MVLRQAETAYKMCIDIEINLCYKVNTFLLSGPRRHPLPHVYSYQA